MQSPIASLAPLDASTISPPHTGQAHAPQDSMFLQAYSGQAIENAMSARYCIFKRVIDLAASSFLLLALLPVGLVLAFLVWATSPGSVFYREERIGRFGVPFRIFKFRSMYLHEADPVSELHTLGHDHVLRMRTFLKHVGHPRVTPIGRYLRKWSLDELPQLLNVFLGQMSLVGPRPIVEAERAVYGPQIRFYTLLLPGMTGLWQVSGRSDVSFVRRVYLDSLYCVRWSLLKDFAIIAKTIPAVLKKTGAY